MKVKLHLRKNMNVEKCNFLGNRCSRKIHFLLSVCIMVFLLSCGPGKQTPRADVSSFEELKELVQSRQFEIEHDWAQPITGNQINLIGNPNYIRFLRDSVELFLPYFGIRHQGGNYGGRDGGIEFEGVPENLKIIEAENNKSIAIEFEAEENQENFDFRIVLFSNGRASTSVNTSDRSAISYRGFVNNLPEDLKEE